LSQLTHQVALVQYPSLSTSRVRHVELVPLGATRLMTVFITDSGRVEQRLIDVSAPIDEAFLVELRSKLNSALGGLGLSDAAAQLEALPERFDPEHRPLVKVIASSLREQALAHRQDKLLMAGTA